MGLWDPDRRQPAAVRSGSYGGHVLRLDPQVELFPERLGEPVREVNSADSPTPARRALHADRQPVDDIQVPSDDRVDARPANLDDDPLTGVERRRVHLRDRRGRQRGAIEALKHVIDLGTQAGAQHRFDLRPRNLWGVVLQSAQLVDELGRQQVAPGRE